MNDEQRRAALLEACRAEQIPEARPHPCPTFYAGYVERRDWQGIPYLLFKDYNTAKRAMMTCAAIVAPRHRAFLVPHDYGFTLEVI